jgi:hypothetical protein
MDPSTSFLKNVFSFSHVLTFGCQVIKCFQDLGPTTKQKIQPTIQFIKYLSLWIKSQPRVKSRGEDIFRLKLGIRSSFAPFFKAGASFGAAKNWSKLSVFSRDLTKLISIIQIPKKFDMNKSVKVVFLCSNLSSSLSCRYFSLSLSCSPRKSENLLLTVISLRLNRFMLVLVLTVYVTYEDMPSPILRGFIT